MFPYTGSLYRNNNYSMASGGPGFNYNDGGLFGRGNIPVVSFNNEMSAGIKSLPIQLEEAKCEKRITLIRIAELEKKSIKLDKEIEQIEYKISNPPPTEFRFVATTCDVKK